MRVDMYVIFFSLLYTFAAISIVQGADRKGKEVMENGSASTSTTRDVPVAKGNLEYHQAKLHKHMTLREHTATAEDFQVPNHYVDMSKKGSKKEFKEVHSLAPLTQHFRRKSGKHIQNIEDITNGKKLPGKKTLQHLKDKGKVPENYQVPQSYLNNVN